MTCRCHLGEHCAASEKTEQRPTTCDECQCHLGPNYPCTIPGGCGHLHKPATVKLGARIVAEQGLCPTCTRVTTDAIAELPRDYVDLTHALAHGTAGLAELVTATKDLPAPLRVSIAAFKAELVRVATSWAEPVADILRVDWDSQEMDRHTRPGYALQRAARILAQNMPVLLALRDVEIRVWADNGHYNRFEPRDGLDGATDLLQLHRIARAALGQTKLVHQLPAPCPNCGNRALVRDSGDDKVHCQRCRLQWPEEDYRRLTLVLAADYDGVEVTRQPREFRPESGAEGTVARPVAAR